MLSFESMVRDKNEHNLDLNYNPHKQKMFIPKCRDEFQFFLYAKNNALQIPINDNSCLSHLAQSKTLSFIHNDNEDSKMEKINSVCYLVTSKTVTSFNDSNITNLFPQH